MEWLIWLVTLVFLSGNAYAANAIFTWTPNVEVYLKEYRIRCDAESMGGTDSAWEYIKIAAKDNLVDGKVQFVWVDFPVGRQHCVCVAVGNDDTLSDPSNQVETGIDAMSAPQGLQVVMVNDNFIEDTHLKDLRKYLNDNTHKLDDSDSS